MVELKILTDKIRIEDTPLTDEEQNEFKKQTKRLAGLFVVSCYYSTCFIHCKNRK